MKYHKGQILFLSGIAEFEGQNLPMVIPAKVATVNPQRDGTFRYNVHIWEPTKAPTGCVGAKYNCPESDLHECAMAALEASIEAVDAARQVPAAGGARG